MTKIIITIIVSANFYFTSCSQNSIEQKRKETMMEIVNAIKKNDLVQIYNLIDTNFFKEGLDYDIKFLNKRLGNAKTPIEESQFKLFDDKGLKNDANYRIRIYIKDNQFDFVDLIFNFNQDEYKKVYSFNKEVHPLKEESIKPLPIIH